MKRIVLLMVFVLVQSLTAFAQKKASGMLGLGIDFGNGITLVGPSYRSYFSDKVAGQAEVLFGGGLTVMSGYYHFRGDFPTAKSFKWYVGGGPSLAFGGGETAFLLRPMAGIEVQLPETPLGLTFDWRPALSLKGGDFEPAFFGLGFRFKI